MFVRVALCVTTQGGRMDTHGTLTPDHVGPVVATIRHAGHAHVLTLAPSPLGGMMFDVVLCVHADNTFTVVTYDDVMTLPPTLDDNGVRGVHHDTVKEAYGFADDTVMIPALVVDETTISNN